MDMRNMSKAKLKGQSTGVLCRELPIWLLGIFIFLGGGCEDKVIFPVDYSPPTEFQLGAEDVLIVSVWKNQDLSREVVVRPDGNISMPLIGDVRAAGLTPNALAKSISDRLTEFMASPTVSVQVKEVNSYFIYVLGEVLKPGKYPLKSYATVLQGASMAGGFTPFASKNSMYVLRLIFGGKEGPRQIQIPAPYKDTLSGAAAGNFYLKSGDTIVVP